MIPNLTDHNSSKMNSKNEILANELNDEMQSAVLPVSVFVGVEIVCGIFGNLLVLYVYFFRYHRCNFKYFVLCLAITDTLSTFITMPGELVTQTYWYIYPYPVFCRIKSFFNAFTIFNSAFCLFVISMDRYRKVCTPLEWQIRPTMASRLCFLQGFISIVFSFPVGFLSGTYTYQEHYKGEVINVTVCEKDEILRFTKYPLIYTIAKEAIISTLMVLMFVIYILVCRKLWQTKFSPGETAVKRNISDKTLESQTKSSSEGISETLEQTKDENEDSCETLSTPANQSSLQSKPEQSFDIADVQLKGRAAKKFASRVRRKTLIMLILTTVFISTTILYLTLLNLIMKGVLRSLSNTQKSIYFFFFRLYFINHVINPILFGILDLEFRTILKQVGNSLFRICVK